MSRDLQVLSIWNLTINKPNVPFLVPRKPISIMNLIIKAAMKKKIPRMVISSQTRQTKINIRL